MIHRQVHLTVLNADCLLLWEPGDNSPFEMDNSYAFSSSPPSDVSKISYRFNAEDGERISARQYHLPEHPGGHSIHGAGRPKSHGGEQVQQFLPLREREHGPAGLLYGPNRDSLAGSLPFDIFYQFLSPVSDLTLEANIVPGSVQVQVNGTSETRIQSGAGLREAHDAHGYSSHGPHRRHVQCDRAGDRGRGHLVRLAGQDPALRFHQPLVYNRNSLERRIPGPSPRRLIPNPEPSSPRQESMGRARTCRTPRKRGSRTQTPTPPAS